MFNVWEAFSLFFGRTVGWSVGWPKANISLYPDHLGSKKKNCEAYTTVTITVKLLEISLKRTWVSDIIILGGRTGGKWKSPYNFIIIKITGTTCVKIDDRKITSLKWLDGFRLTITPSTNIEKPFLHSISIRSCPPTENKQSYSMLARASPPNIIPLSNTQAVLCCWW